MFGGPIISGKGERATLRLRDSNRLRSSTNFFLVYLVLLVAQW